jgi:replicative DNA helicase Mcm
MTETLEKVREAASMLRDKLIVEMLKLIKQMDDEGLDKINPQALSPMLRAWIKGHYGIVPNTITKDLLKTYIEVLENYGMFVRDTNIDEQTVRGELTEKNNEHQVFGAFVYRSLKKQLGDEKFETLLKSIKETYGLPRPVHANTLLVMLDIMENDRIEVIPISLIEKRLKEDAGFTKSMIDRMRWDFFGNGNVAKALQAVLFDAVGIVNGEKAFKLKDSVVKFIKAKVLELLGYEQEAEEMLDYTNNAKEFLRNFRKDGEAVYLEKIKDIVLGEKVDYFYIDYLDLAKYDPRLARRLFDEPEFVLGAFENAVMELQEELFEEISSENPELFDEEFKPVFLEVHVGNFPHVIRPRDVRTDFAEKFVAVEGIITSASKVVPFFEIATYVCKHCSKEIGLFNRPTRIPAKPPSKCPDCDAKGSFELDVRKSKKVEIQHFIVRDAPEMLNVGENAKELEAYLLGKMAGAVDVGDKVILYGILRVKERLSKKIAETDYVLEVIHVEQLNRGIQLELSKKDVQEVLKLGEMFGEDLPDAVARSIAPWIRGYEEVKKALALAVVSAEGLWDKRTTIHVLLAGDPGVGKSRLALDLENVAPKFLLAEGGGSSRAGLTASFEKDELTGKFTVRGGLLVLGSDGIVLVDEFSNLKREDINALKTCMEHGFVAPAKAGISNVKLRATATIVGTANPKAGKIDRTRLLIDQLDIPFPVLTRFDLIFAFFDEPDEEKDEEIGWSILSEVKRKKGEPPKRIIPAELLKKLFAYARFNVFPEVTEEAQRLMVSEFVKLRKKTSTNGNSVSRRIMDALVRLSYAHAKLRLADKVEKVDVEEAVRLIWKSLEYVAYDPETGEIDVSILQVGVPSREREKFELFIRVMENLARKYGNIRIDIIKNVLNEKGLSDDEIERFLERGEKLGYLRQLGDFVEWS